MSCPSMRTSSGTAIRRFRLFVNWMTVDFAFSLNPPSRRKAPDVSRSSDSTRALSCGAVGFLGYDVVRSFEPTVPSPDKDELGVPEMLFMVMSLLVVFDHRERRMKLIANAFLDGAGDNEKVYAAAKALIGSALERLLLSCELPYIDAQRKGPPAETQSNMSRERFEAGVETAKRHIVAGDIF